MDTENVTFNTYFSSSVPDEWLSFSSHGNQEELYDSLFGGSCLTPSATLSEASISPEILPSSYDDGPRDFSLLDEPSWSSLGSLGSFGSLEASALPVETQTNDWQGGTHSFDSAVPEQNGLESLGQWTEEIKESPTRYAASIPSIPIPSRPQQGTRSSTDPFYHAGISKRSIPISSAPPQTSPRRRRPGRRGGLSPEARRNAGLMRRIGACQNCRDRKEKCDPGIPCKSCVLFYKSDLQLHPCRGSLEDLTVTFLSKSFLRHGSDSLFLNHCLC